MGFPDRIERAVDLAHPPSRVWVALTTAEGLASWFGDVAEIDLRPGGEGRLAWTDEGHDQRIRVERVEPEHVLGFTWQIYGLPADDPRRTYVEFTLSPSGTGTTLTVVETGFAQLTADEHAVAHRGNTEGWSHELDDLATHLDAVAV